MSELDILFPISEGNRNADDMGIPVVRDILEVLHDSDLGGTRFGPMLHDAIAEIKLLRSALSAMLTEMGLDENEYNNPTFDQARKALAHNVKLRGCGNENEK